jgi:hypothetical protein
MKQSWCNLRYYLKMLEQTVENHEEAQWGGRAPGLYPEPSEYKDLTSESGKFRRVSDKK